MTRWIGVVLLGLGVGCTGASSPESFSNSGEGGGPGGGDDVGGIIDSGVDPGAGDEGGDGDGGDGSSGGSGGATSPLDPLADAFCDLIERCESTFGPTFESTAQCEDFYGILVGTGLGFGSPDVFEVNQQALSACISTVDSLSCDAVFGDEPPEGCDFEEIFVGILPVGACCDERGGCEPGSYCEGSSDETVGLCVAFVPENGDCSNAQCAAGLRCVPGETAVTCQLAAAFGESCGEFDCAAPYVCVGLPSGTCGEPLPAGATCVEDSECASDDCFFDECQQGFDVVDGPGLGEPCTESCGEAAFGELYCVPESGGSGRVCQPAATTFGAPCDPEGGNAPDCNPLFGLVCNQETFQCQELPTVGEACDSFCQPLESAFCDLDFLTGGGECRSRVPAGGQCEPQIIEFVFFTQCELGFTCEEGTCQPGTLVDPICTDEVNVAP